MKKLLGYLKPYLLFTLLTPLTMLGEVVADLFQPSIMSQIVDDGVIAGNMNIIISCGIKMLLLVIFGGLCGVSSAAFGGAASQSFGCDLRNDLFSRVTSLSFQQTDRFTPGSLITRLTNDVSAVQDFVATALRGFVRSILLFVGGTIMMLRLGTSFGIVLLCALPLEIITMIILLKKAAPVFSRIQKKLDGVNNVVRENISGARVVKAFVREDYECSRFATANDELMNTNLQVQRLMALLNPLLMIVLNAAVVAIIYIGGFQVALAENGMGVGSVMAAVTYVTQIFMSIMMVSMMFQSVSRARASAERIIEVLDTEPVITDGENTAAADLRRGTVSFRGVSFRYPEASGEPVLKGISLEIRAGESFAILGATGSGKSTLVNLIPRFYDATRGEILVDGISVRDYRTADLRDKIGIVLQKSELFSGTVAENISWGNSSADIKSAAEVAQAEEFISRMPKDFDEVISEKGASLSGGQKQRISIARAIAKQPEILIFDDSTSALDSGTEARLQAALRERLRGTTVIKIAQRISAVKSCDRIAVLENGMISAVGTHEELLCNSEVYREICASQTGNDEEAAENA